MFADALVHIHSGTPVLCVIFDLPKSTTLEVCVGFLHRSCPSGCRRVTIPASISSLLLQLRGSSIIRSIWQADTCKSCFDLPHAMPTPATLDECREIFSKVESYSRTDEEGRVTSRRKLIASGAVAAVTASLDSPACPYDLKVAALACLSELAFAVSDVALLDHFRAAGADSAALRAFVTAHTVEVKTWAAFALCNMNANSCSGLQRTWDIGVVEAVVTTVAVALAADEALRSAGVCSRTRIADFSVTPSYELPVVPAVAEPLLDEAVTADDAFATLLGTSERAGCFASTPESRTMASVCTLGPSRLISMCLGLMTMFARDETFTGKLRVLTLGECAVWKRGSKVSDEPLRVAVASRHDDTLESGSGIDAVWFKRRRWLSPLFAADTSALALALEVVAQQDDNYAHIGAAIVAYTMGSDEIEDTAVAASALPPPSGHPNVSAAAAALAPHGLRLPAAVIQMLMAAASAGLANQLYRGFAAYRRVWTYLQVRSVVYRRRCLPSMAARRPSISP